MVFVVDVETRYGAYVPLRPLLRRGEGAMADHHAPDGLLWRRGPDDSATSKRQSRSSVAHRIPIAIGEYGSCLIAMCTHREELSDAYARPREDHFGIARHRRGGRYVVPRATRFH